MFPKDNIYMADTVQYRAGYAYETNITTSDRELMEATHVGSLLLQQANAVLIVAGMGMDFNATLPDYRHINGFRNGWYPSAKEQLSYNELTHAEIFKSDPSLAWGFEAFKSKIHRNSEPSDGYTILRKFVCTYHKYIYDHNYNII